MTLKNPETLSNEKVKNWVDKINTIEDPDDMMSFVKLTFPTILCGRSPGFTKHLQLFDKNWEYILGKCPNSVKREILIIRDFDYSCCNDPEYSMVNSFMSVLTRWGYCVRSSTDIQLCKKCNRVILTELMCNKLDVNYSNNCCFYNKKLSNLYKKE